MTITVTVVGRDALMAKIGAIPDKARSLVRRTLEGLGVQFVAYVKSQKLSGQVLKNQSGLLRRSINYEVIDSGDSFMVEAGSRGVAYAAIHEYGGQTKPHVIRARGRALAFQKDGKTVFAKFVNHPGSKIPERSYMRSSLTEFRPKITAALEATMRGLMK